ncbi:MAG: hypothetical protein JSU92_07470 [Deltaproteobacteria bacterium]|nr:MAG: hypothetical protein JSU92_07470 [Deltaproteobacteria bacterium]
MLIKRLIPVFFVLLLAAATFLLLLKLEAYPRWMERNSEKMTLPRGDYLKIAVLGYDQIAADFYWLKTIQYIGDKQRKISGYPMVYPLVDLVTDLDYRFDYAYQVAGVLLAIYDRNIEKSNIILEKGFKNVPGVWQIPMYLGFNHFFFLKDYLRAAKYIEIAASLPGRPTYLPLLAARLYSEAKDPMAGIEFLTEILEVIDVEMWRNFVGNRIKLLMIERDLIYLEKAIKDFSQREGRRPRDLRELVMSGMIKRIPPEPFEGRYLYDPGTGEVKSSTNPERLRIYK